MREIADELNVETVLHATVEYADGRVRIRPQLVAGATGQTSWAESYERGFEDIFAIESEIATEIAARCEPSSRSPSKLRSRHRRRDRRQPMTAYLRARNVRASPVTICRLEYLDEATRLDPGFALGARR